MVEEVQTGGIGAITVNGWRIYYGDGKIADSREVEWQFCPNGGVQVVIVFYEETYKTWEQEEGAAVLKEYPYRKLFTQCDYYWQWGAGSGEEANAAGAPDLKFGKALPDDEWWAIYNKAHADMVF